MVAGTRVQVEKVSNMVRFWIYCERRADRRPQGSFWLERLGEWCYRLSKWKMEGGAGYRRKGTKSPLWNVLFKSIQGETLSWQLDIPAGSSGKRSEVEI